MAAQITWSIEALDDIESIAEYIAKDSQHYAQSVILKLFQTAESIKEHPLMGRAVPEVNDTLPSSVCKVVSLAAGLLVPEPIAMCDMTPAEAALAPLGDTNTTIGVRAA